MTNAPFRPLNTFSATVTTTPVTLVTQCDTNCYRIYNAHTDIISVKPSEQSWSVPVPPGAVEILSFNQNQSFVLTAASGSGTMYITTGEGA